MLLELNWNCRTRLSDIVIANKKAFQKWKHTVTQRIGLNAMMKYSDFCIVYVPEYTEQT